VTGDYRSEKIGSKIRDAQLELIPYMLVIGGREMEQSAVAVRDRIEGDLGSMPLDAAIDKLQREVLTKQVRQVASGKSAGLTDRGGAHEY
jgi:threonyl-tRNA synthetase